jgi:mannose-6-phosphate isomerase-like protein (cupin superfamily)
MARLPDSLDAMTAAPDHHFVLLENDRVRVLDTRLAPGESTPLHAHVWAGALYILSWSDFVRKNAAGEIILDSRDFQTPPSPGSALWGPSLAAHSVTNVGDSLLHVIAVELKSSD